MNMFFVYVVCLRSRFCFFFVSPAGEADSTMFMHDSDNSIRLYASIVTPASRVTLICMYFTELLVISSYEHRIASMGM